MKLTAILLLTACLQVSARGYGQSITLTADQMPLQTVMQQIKDQTGYSFFYNAEWLEKSQPVTANLKNVPLNEALDQLFRNQPLSYSVINNTIVLKLKSTSNNPNSSSDIPPPVDIHGHVTDSLGNPLAGASVTVKGSKRGTSTDANGDFVLHGVNENATLIISFTGFNLKNIKLTGSGSILVRLTHSTSQLDQIQVIAYGTTTQRLSTSDVSTVGSKEIEQQPVSNPLQALEGRVPGLFITQASGFSGSGMTVQIRGQNSLTNGNDPFYVVDGVPYVSQLLPNQGVILGNSGLIPNTFVNTFQTGNPLSFINPSDIETISILKDADATAIYGSRAANGAVLITTKKGKAGATKVDINLQAGWQQVADILPLMNTGQYITMRKQAISLDGLTIQPTDYDVNGFWDESRSTNWQKTLIGNTGQFQNYNLSISGGSANTQFLIGTTYNRQTTVLPGTFADQKGSLHFSVINSSINQKFHLTLTGSYLTDNNKLPASDLTNTAVGLAPDAPPLYKNDGSLNWAIDANGNSSWTNPLAALNNKYTSKVNNLIGNAVLSYKILPGLEIKSSFGYTNLDQNDIITYPLSSTPPELRPITQSSAGYTSNNINSWIVEPQITYYTNIGKGKLDGLVGSTINQVNSEGNILLGYGYSSDQLLSSIASAASIYSAGSTSSVYKYNALFARLGYNWDNKYIISLNARRDGSSRFGQASAFHNFGSVAAAWIFSNENPLKASLPFLSFGKLHASYGTTGNDQIGDYRYLNLYSPTYVGVPYQGAVGLYPANLTNPDLHWEETKKAEVGLDLGFFKDRILLNTSYYLNHSSNQLLEYGLPIITGFNNVTENFPATVENKGWEFVLNTINIRNTSFSWSTSINLSIPKNVLTSFPNQTNSAVGSVYFVGQSIHVQKLYHLLGVDPASGEYLFQGTQGTTSNPSYSTDRTVLINPVSSLFGGFLNEFKYKGFSLDILFQFVKQVGPNSNAFGFRPGPGSFSGPYDYGNQPTTVLNAWSSPGDISDIQRYNSNNSYSRQLTDAIYSDGGYSDASFIRLKNLSLSWQLPDNWKAKWHMQNARLYVQGQNLLTITHYKGLDPETLSSTTLPPLMVFTFGIQVGF